MEVKFYLKKLFTSEDIQPFVDALKFLDVDGAWVEEIFSNKNNLDKDTRENKL